MNKTITTLISKYIFHAILPAYRGGSDPTSKEHGKPTVLSGALNIEITQFITFARRVTWYD